ncbi:MAG TPA: efflux RND transporter periplasmic adaptor subunit [Candidatus Paceibacterota bacterium]
MVTIFKKIIKKPFGIPALVAGCIVVLVSGWLIVRPSGSQTELIEVKRGSIVQSVSVTGRVKPVKAVDLAFKQGGKISNIFVTEGDKVQVGEILAKQDSSEAEVAVRDAEVNLENAKLALDKINLQHAQQLREDTLNKSYEAGLSTLANLYSGFTATLDALDKIFFGTDLYSQSQQNNIEYYASYNSTFAAVPANLKRIYLETENLYQLGLTSYRAAERGSGEARDQAIRDGHKLTVKAAQMIKTGRNVVLSLENIIVEGNLVHTKKTIIDGHVRDLASYATSIDSYLQDLLTNLNAINSGRDTLETYPLDSQTQKLTIQQRENSLRNAKDRLSDYFIRSPIAGIVTKQDGKIGEIIASNAKIISLISEADLEIEVNIPEADIGKIKLGNKARVTLDAYMDVAFTATIVAIEPAEIIIDGVPTYKTTLQFEKLNERIKPGMTANLDITTAVHDNVIIIPQRAVIRQGERQLVQILVNNQNKSTKEQGITTGLRGSDGTVEVLNGLNEGDKIIGIALP